jgi:acyl dehydratase
MPKIDLSLVGRRTEPKNFEYTWKDVVLYALSVGTSAEELPLVYEKAPGGLTVLPSFCVVPALFAWPCMGDDFQWPLALHGEQRTRLFRPLPPEGTVVQSGEVVSIHDKGKGALIRVRITGRTPAEEPLYEAEWALFYLGAGGFGGDPGPKAETFAPPEGVAPDFGATYRIPANQAALYRLNGDVNPLHLDPQAAALGGFKRPILHGLCTYGFATRAIVTEALGGRVERLREFNARFSSPVYPGDTLTVEGWLTAEGCLVQARTQDAVVLKNAVAVFA